MISRARDAELIGTSSHTISGTTILANLARPHGMKVPLAVALVNRAQRGLLIVAELLIGCEEDRTLRAVLVGMLREMMRK